MVVLLARGTDYTYHVLELVLPGNTGFMLDTIGNLERSYQNRIHHDSNRSPNSLIQSNKPEPLSAHPENKVACLEKRDLVPRDKLRRFIAPTKSQTSNPNRVSMYPLENNDVETDEMVLRIIQTSKPLKRGKTLQSVLWKL